MDARTTLATKLATKEVVAGLEHYRSIVRQDSLGERPHAARLHAEVRRRVYADLAAIAELRGPEAALRVALERYAELPLVSDLDDDERVRLSAQEHGLENFFVMMGLDPTVRHQVWSIRPRLMREGMLVS